MTLHEFITKRNRYRNATALTSLAAFGVFMGTAFLMTQLEPQRDRWPRASWIAMCVAAGVILVAAFPLMWFAASKLATRFGMRCPHCTKVVDRMSSLVIATGKCGRCGGRVLDDAA